MPSDNVFVRLEGVDKLKAALRDVAGKIRTKAVRGALREAAKVIQAQARSTAPVLSKPSPYRNPGTVKKRIAVRASKFARKAGNEGVYVNVRPLRGKAQNKRFGKAGAKNPNDPFYWRFLEFGTKFMKARSFLRPAADSKGAEAIKKFMDAVIPQIEKLNRRVR